MVGPGLTYIPSSSQFLETIPGRTTIRAFGWSQPAKDRNETLVDRAQRPFYLLLMVQQWLTLVLDLVTTGIALLVVGISMGLRGSSSVSPGFTGVSLVQLIALTETLKLLIQFWTSLETSIGAVARIRAFEQETPDEDISHRRDSVLPDRWPGVGAVTVDNVSASYTDNLDNKALNGVSLAVKPGEKLGICGRTGR